MKEKYEETNIEMKEEIMLIIKEMLQLDHVNENDDFFRIGGHSLIAVQIVLRLEEKYRISIPLQIIFYNPIISDLVMKIRKLMINSE